MADVNTATKRITDARRVIAMQRWYDDEVPPECGCTNCGERRIDYLELDETSHVKCTSCGYEYDV